MESTRLSTGIFGKGQGKRPTVNNDFYNELGDRWYNDPGHPIAILRVEAETKVNYLLEKLQEHFGSSKDLTLLDVACGAGFVANPLGEAGYSVTGVDLAESALTVAATKAPSNVNYQAANAYQLPFAEHSYDAVLMMDCLEHFDDYGKALDEAKRVLKPGGLLLYHTFNRNFLSYLLACKAIGWFAREAPDHIHVYHLLIKPEELAAALTERGFVPKDLQGISLDFKSPGLLKALWEKQVNPGLRFKLSRSTAVGYLGTATMPV